MCIHIIMIIITIIIELLQLICADHREQAVMVSVPYMIVALGQLYMQKKM